jgi:hypothetical protein
MNSKIFTFLVIAVTILFISCKKDSDAPSGGACSHGFGFLKDGASLTYDYSTLFTPNSTVTISFDSISAGVFSETIRDVSNSTVLGTRYMKGCNGWLLNDIVQNVSDTLKYMKESRALGEEWVYFDPQFMNYNDYKVFKKDVSVTVPAGTFTCDEILYTQRGAINTDTLWWNNTYSFIKYSGLLFSYELKGKNF